LINRRAGAFIVDDDERCAGSTDLAALNAP
jgi:hypothetical protein